MLAARNIVLILTFLVELFSGFFVLWLALFRLVPKKKEEQKSQRAGYSHESVVLQLVIMGSVNVFSSVTCYLMVSLDLAGYASWYITYIQWGLTTPSIVVVLCMLCSIDFNTTILLAFLDALIMLCGVMATLFEKSYLKYSWFTLGSIFFVQLFGTLLFKKSRIVKGEKTKLKAGLEKEEKSEVLRDKKLSDRLIILTITTWCLYPITWLIESTKVIDGFDADILHAVFEGTNKRDKSKKKRNKNKRKRKLDTNKGECVVLVPNHMVN
eukprot:Phypoly_transcript_14121.p1 GENE.Phypoly_transcript_14121~~Phypoly_transcript_14121.p1  ORF type:complete len:268 (+),score=28.21 Phypoly_transcript_14121:177-980(+)